MNSFTFYKNYYELIKYLKNDEKLELYNAIFEYIFEDKEPTFDGLLNGIWINLKMPLDTSKNKGNRGGRPTKKEEKKDNKKTKRKPNENQNETKRETNNNISTFLFLLSNNIYFHTEDKRLLREKIKEWIEYKNERKEFYKEKGMKSLIAEIENNCKEFGDEEVIKVINKSMASNYKGIVFEKLSKSKSNQKTKNEEQWEFLKELYEKENSENEYKGNINIDSDF